jgi:hypothetical protein
MRSSGSSGIKGVLVESVAFLLIADALQLLKMVVYLFDQIGEARPGDRIRVGVPRRRLSGTKAVLQIDNRFLFVGFGAVFHTFLYQTLLGLVRFGRLGRRRRKRDHGLGVGLLADRGAGLNGSLLGSEQFAQGLAQITHVVAALCQQESRSGVAGGVLAADDVLSSFDELPALDPNYRAWDVPRVAKRTLRELVTVADVNPDGTFVDHPSSILVGDLVYQWVANQLNERLLVETHQDSVGSHRHRCVSRGAGYQGLLAEAIPGAELGKMHLAPAAGRLSRDVAITLFDDVVVTARVALPDDQLVRGRIHAFHAFEDTLDVLWRQVCEALRLQHADHPVRRLLPGDVAFLQIRCPGVEIREPQSTL